MTKFSRFLSFLLFVGTLSLTTSCVKTDEIIEAISESDIVEIIEANLQNNAGGLVSNLEDIATQLVEAVTSGELCDTLYTEIIEENFQSVQFQAAYTSTLSYEMACDTLNLPQAATFSTLTSTMYNSVRMVSEDDSDFAGNATGLLLSSKTLTIDGDYSRTGTQELNFMEQENITSTLSMNLTTLEISKQGLEIESGNATFSLSGSTSNETFSYDGTIVFKGGNTATVTINGTAYDINWN